MPAELKFYAGQNFAINELAGSGLGFYGANGFGSSIGVNAWNERTFITNSAGTIQGAEVDNVKWISSGSGVLGQAGSGVSLLAIPNYLSTLEVRFTNDTAVQVQNASVRIYDRVNINNPPSGVTCRIAEIIHPDTTQNLTGSGDSTWITAAGSGTVVNLAPSPGVSGLYAGNGSNSVRADTSHSWYLAISCSPDSVGTKTFALYCSLEYL